jgi:uncharacterized membrane protein YkvI
VVIAGGYGTGRELVEYFLNYGPLGGLLGMLIITTVMWSVLLALTFEFSRMFRAYDYRTFFMKLLGPFWFIFEILYFILLFIVLGVIGSAAGALLRDNFGIPFIIGVMIMLGAIGFLIFKGSGLIEKFLSSWSIVLYIVYGLFLIVAVVKFGPEIQNLLGGLIGILPGLLFFIAVVSHYPAVLPEEVPADYILRNFGFTALRILYLVVLIGTLIETGTGFIHAVNQRIQSALQAKGKKLPRWQRPVVALVLLLIGLGLSTFGLIPLIAKGYGSVSWGFFIVYIIPLVTLGLYKIIKKKVN